MLRVIVGKLWRHTPVGLRRFGVRLLEPRFRVTAGAVLVDEEGRVLLLKHTLRQGSGWGIPGGFLKKGEQPEEALRRELREEVGLELARVELAFVRTIAGAGQIEIIFRGGPRAGSEAVPRGLEIGAADWFARDALPGGCTQSQRRIIERALSVSAKVAD